MVTYQSPFPAAIYVCDTSDRDRWLEARNGYLGASDGAAVLGVSKWASPYSLWHSRVNGSETETTERMLWGSLLEGAIIAESNRRFQSIDGRSIHPSGIMIRSAEYPWMAATLDGIATFIHPDGTVEVWPVEAKNVDAWMAEEWADGVPIHYVAQCQQLMCVTGARRVTVVALIGGNRWVWQDIERDEEMIARLMVEGALLWDRIQSKLPPPVDGHEATTQALAAIETDGSEVELSSQAEELTARYSIADAAYKAAKECAEIAKERRDAVANEIRLMLGAAERGKLPDGRVWQFMVERRAGYTVAPSESRVLRLKAAKAAKKGRAA